MKHFIFILGCIISACSSSNNIENCIEAELQTEDSVYFSESKHSLLSVYSYHSGKRVGKFYSFEKDTAVGYEEYIDDYYKRTIKYLGDEYIYVELYNLQNSKYNLTEKIVYLGDAIQQDKSHYIHFTNTNESIKIELFSIVDFDHISIYDSDTVYFNGKMHEFSLNPFIKSFKNNLVIYGYNILNDLDSLQLDTEGLFYYASLNRVSLQSKFIEPNKWVINSNCLESTFKKNLTSFR